MNTTFCLSTDIVAVDVPSMQYFRKRSSKDFLLHIKQSVQEYLGL